MNRFAKMSTVTSGLGMPANGVELFIRVESLPDSVPREDGSDILLRPTVVDHVCHHHRDHCRVRAPHRFHVAARRREECFRSALNIARAGSSAKREKENKQERPPAAPPSLAHSTRTSSKNSSS